MIPPFFFLFRFQREAVVGQRNEEGVVHVFVKRQRFSV